jgi:hypothetical protein
MIPDGHITSSPTVRPPAPLHGLLAPLSGSQEQQTRTTGRSHEREDRQQVVHDCPCTGDPGLSASAHTWWPSQLWVRPTEGEV